MREEITWKYRVNMRSLSLKLEEESNDYKSHFMKYYVCFVTMRSTEYVPQ